MSGDDDIVSEIETPVAFVIGGVSEENISGGPRCQFVSGFGGEIGITGATEHRTRASAHRRGQLHEG
jgi:hypothetical protein